MFITSLYAVFVFVISSALSFTNFVFLITPLSREYRRALRKLITSRLSDPIQLIISPFPAIASLSSSQSQRIVDSIYFNFLNFALSQEKIVSAADFFATAASHLPSAPSKFVFYQDAFVFSREKIGSAASRFHSAAPGFNFSMQNSLHSTLKFEL